MLAVIMWLVARCRMAAYRICQPFSSDAHARHDGEKGTRLEGMLAMILLCGWSIPEGFISTNLRTR